MVFKLVINNPKDGKSYQMDFEDKVKLVGKKVGTSISGSVIGLSGYELEITGGSDICGNPMRKDVDGSSSRRLLLTKGIGFKSGPKGERRKKRVHGRTISDKIVQINLKVIKAGSKKLEELFASEKEESEQKEGTEDKAEEKPEESKSEEKSEKKEEPKEEKEESKKEQKEEKEKVAPKEKEEKPEQKEEKSEEQEEKKTTNQEPQTKNDKESTSKETKNEKPKTNNDNKEA